jgi:hypothetical protein
MIFQEGFIVLLEGSPDEWVIVSVEKNEVTVCHSGMESYQLGVAPEDIEEVLGYREDGTDYYFEANEYYWDMEEEED